jgi:CheY-like chemotaxis protein
LRAANNTPIPTGETDDSESTALSQLKVLVAEDNLSNQRLVTLFLQKLGCQTTVAYNGRLALEACQNQDYDVVLMDLQMPVMDGYEATSAIRRMLPAGSQPWIIALTAHALEAERQRCMEVGMNDFLTKPLRKELLEHALLRSREAKNLDVRSLNPVATS